jgi:hypothetical protein
LISGNFDQVTIVDPLGRLAGFNALVSVTSSAVTLTITAAPFGAIRAIPEPGSLTLVLGAGAVLLVRRSKIGSGYCK